MTEHDDKTTSLAAEYEQSRSKQSKTRSGRIMFCFGVCCLSVIVLFALLMVRGSYSQYILEGEIEVPALEVAELGLSAEMYYLGDEYKDFIGDTLGDQQCIVCAFTLENYGDVDLICDLVFHIQIKGRADDVDSVVFYLRREDVSDDYQLELDEDNSETNKVFNCSDSFFLQKESSLITCMIYADYTTIASEHISDLGFYPPEDGVSLITITAQQAKGDEGVFMV